MNRERKYRAWDGEEMFLSPKLSEGLQHLSSWFEAHSVIHTATGKESIIMDWTGLKDKEGKDIYEADIIKLVNADGEIIHAVCEYGIVRREVVGMIGPIEVDIPCFYFKLPNGKKSFPITKNYTGGHDLELFEVVGDIYTAPELLNVSREK